MDLHTNQSESLTLTCMISDLTAPIGTYDIPMDYIWIQIFMEMNQNWYNQTGHRDGEKIGPRYP